MLKQHFADVDDSEIKSERQMQLKTQYLQGFKDGFESQREFCMDVLDKIRAEIEQKIEQERFARSVFRGEEKDDVKAEQCTGSIFAYNNVIRLIDKHRAESEEP